MSNTLFKPDDTEIVRSLVALAKVGVIRLSPEVVHFIIPGNEGRDGVQVWSCVYSLKIRADIIRQVKVVRMLLRHA